jgi:hypothetical protein
MFQIQAHDLEQKREKALLKEFDALRIAPGRRLKEFRLEVLRAGFNREAVLEATSHSMAID